MWGSSAAIRAVIGRFSYSQCLPMIFGGTHELCFVDQLSRSIVQNGPSVWLYVCITCTPLLYELVYYTSAVFERTSNEGCWSGVT